MTNDFIVNVEDMYGTGMTSRLSLATMIALCSTALKNLVSPMTSAADLGTVPPELMGTFNLIFYQTPEDAVFKVLCVE